MSCADDKTSLNHQNFPQHNPQILSEIYDRTNQNQSIGWSEIMKKSGSEKAVYKGRNTGRIGEVGGGINEIGRYITPFGRRVSGCV